MCQQKKDLLNLMFDSLNKHNKDLMDLLSSYNYFRVPNENDFKNVTVELVHQEFIQKPKYIIVLT